MISAIAYANPAGAGARATITGLIARGVRTRPPGGERS